MHNMNWLIKVALLNGRPLLENSSQVSCFLLALGSLVRPWQQLGWRFERTRSFLPALGSQPALLASSSPAQRTRRRRRQRWRLPVFARLLPHPTIKQLFNFRKLWLKWIAHFGSNHILLLPNVSISNFIIFLWQKKIYYLGFLLTRWNLQAKEKKFRRLYVEIDTKYFCFQE